MKEHFDDAITILLIPLIAFGLIAGDNKISREIREEMRKHPLTVGQRIFTRIVLTPASVFAGITMILMGFSMIGTQVGTVVAIEEQVGIPVSVYSMFTAGFGIVLLLVQPYSMATAFLTSPWLFYIMSFFFFTSPKESVPDTTGVMYAALYAAYYIILSKDQFMLLFFGVRSYKDFVSKFSRHRSDVRDTS